MGLVSSLSAHRLCASHEVQQPRALENKVVVITGGNSGVGLGMFQAIAPLGPKIFIAGRSEAKCTSAIEQVKEESKNQDIHFLQVDFESFDSVRDAAKKFQESKLPIHYLFNNAGMMNDKYEETKDGFEKTLRPVLFTELLVENLAQANGARVIHTSSDAYRVIKGGVLQVDEHLPPKKETFSGFNAYGLSKLLQILYANETQRVWAGRGITSYSFTPGMVATNFASNTWMGYLFFKLLYPFQKSIDQGASTGVYCALTDTALANAGSYFRNDMKVDLPENVLDSETCKKVRDLALTRTGLLPK